MAPYREVATKFRLGGQSVVTMTSQFWWRHCYWTSQPKYWGANAPPVATSLAQGFKGFTLLIMTFFCKETICFRCIILNKCVFNGLILAVSRRNVFLHGRWSPVLVGLCVLLQSHLSNQMSSLETIQAKKYIEWHPGLPKKQLFTFLKIYFPF